jgi:hypothetical protein
MSFLLPGNPSARAGAASMASRAASAGARVVAETSCRLEALDTSLPAPESTLLFASTGACNDAAALHTAQRTLREQHKTNQQVTAGQAMSLATCWGRAVGRFCT